MNHDDARMMVERIREADAALGDRITLASGEAVIAVDAAELITTARALAGVGFDRLGMVTAVDYEDRLEMVYRLHSRSLSGAVYMKVALSRDGARVDSLHGIWPAALWQEREVFDLFGIDFVGHPDLRRILLPDDFEGHPLRRDYDDMRLIRRPDYI